MLPYNKLLGGRILTAALFVVLSVAGLGFSVYLFYVSNTLYMYALAASFLVLSLIAGFFNVYASVWYYRSYFYDQYLTGIKNRLKPLKRFPDVAIAVPMFNEDPDMVEKNLSELVKMRYPKEKMHVYLLDDSTDEGTRRSIRGIAKRYGAGYLHRNNRQGFKAGALNNMLKHTNAEFVAVFDSDEYLINKNFLRELLPYFQDDSLSYVQTEKRYAKGSFFSQSVDIFDAFFFKFIQPARALNNTAVFAGSCGLIRRSALDKIGGFPEYVIEDTFFSFESDMHKYKSLYVPTVYAQGRPISTFTALVKQQWRYNYGDTQFIGYFLRRRGFAKRSPFSNMDYITHGFGLNYLSIMLILFTLVSIGIVFSSMPFSHIEVWQLLSQNRLRLDLELLGFFAFTLSLLTPVFLTKIYFNSWKKGLMVFLLNYALAFVRTKAAIATVLRKNPGINWNNKYRVNVASKPGVMTYVNRTKTEIAFSTAMFGLAFLALFNSNIAGGIWLIWYGVLYSLTTVFFLKYG